MSSAHPDTAVSPTTAPPVASMRPIERVHHGDAVVDAYEWLRDKADPAVIAYLEAENAYTEAQTGHLGALSEAIFTEIKARTQESDLTVPVFQTHRGGGAYWYYLRSVEGLQYPIYCRAVADPRDKTPPSVDAQIAGEEVLLDCNRAAEGFDFFSLGALSTSPDGTLLAYARDTTGAERYDLRVLDLRTGQHLDDAVDQIGAGVVWAGNEHIFYTRVDDAWRPYVVHRHQLGRPTAADAEVLTEPDERFWVGVGASRDEEWILIGLSSKLTSEQWLLRASDPEGEFHVVAPRRHGVEYDVEPAGDRLLIVHNDGAEDFALAQAPLDGTSHEQWEPVLAHQPGVRIRDVDAYARHVVVSVRRDGLSGLLVLPRTAEGFGAPQEIGFDEPLYTVDTSGSPEYDTDTIRIEYESMLTPESVFDYDLDSGELSLRKQAAVLPDPAGNAYDASRYIQERGWATADDGTAVPLSIVRRADVPLDGTAPMLLYGYGSYEISIDPSFSIARLSLLDRGVVFAVAHIRGGGELGRSWYDQGKLTSKRNTFTDFVACARWVVEQHYTAPDRLAARGGSAGGLLMGAVANLAPEAFRAIHADVPFVDALTTILDPELPLTVVEWEEWGDPLHDPAVYAYMKSYSPYENVAPITYPAILATTSLNDTRVYFVEPAKWVAKLRSTARNGVDRPILLKTEMAAGHGGVSGRYNAWRQLAFEYAWILDQIGVA